MPRSRHVPPLLRLATHVALVTATAALGACGGAWAPTLLAAQPAPRPGVTVGPRFGDRALDESSGLAASTALPGVAWTINDSGDESRLFAVRIADGRTLARVAVPDARNRDWEAIAPGPCTPGGAADGCLYVGDVGDNGADDVRGGHRTVTLYRLPEPRPTGNRFPAASARPEALRVTYADAAHDVEAIAVFPNTDVWLLTKRRHRRADGTLRPVLVYRVDGSAWSTGRATAALVDSMPALVPDGGLATMVTDASLDLARRLLALRTYTTVHLVALAPAPAAGRWRVDAGRAATRCDVRGLAEPQGEGLAILPGASGSNRVAGAPAVLLLSSEANRWGAGGLATAVCATPGPMTGRAR